MRKNQRQKLILAVRDLLEEERRMQGDKLDAENGQRMQEKAIFAGTLLEEAGQGTDEIHLLEDYCEYVYRRCMEDGLMPALGMEGVRLLETIIERIEQGIPEEKNKILFLPYKSCMWDSMESIYECALQDVDAWEVAVVPVPYILKQENRKVCEEGFFRNKAGFCSPLDYKLAEERPDVIVIHNPYDQYNKISEVDGSFFSEELKKYTRHLVYIPYFAAQKDYTKADKIILPGIRNATDIFVQSEKIRREYLHWYPHKNIKALGCPKIDRIVNEGTKERRGQRTFLLNTHLYMVQNAPQLLVSRIGQVLDFFSGHPQYKLIWRPHPLSLSCFADDRYKERYQDLIGRAKQLENVRYDESEDFFEALSEADAYIGDISSLVSLFGIMGKPIYLFEREDRGLFCWDEYLSFLDYQRVGDRIWAVGRKTPGIYSMNLQLSDVKLEHNLVQGRKAQPYPYYLAVRLRGKEAYVFFENRPCVQKIDLEMGEETEIQYAAAIPGDAYTVQDVHEYHGHYYLIPASKGSPLLKFDGERLLECPGWKENLEGVVGGGQGYWMNACGYTENQLFFAALETNHLIFVDLDNFEVASYKVGGDGCRLETAAYDGEKFWLAGSAQRALYCWSAENGLEGVYDKFPVKMVLGEKYSFLQMVFYQDTVWCIPGSASGILIFDKRAETFRMLELPELVWLKERERERCEKFHAVLQRGSELILFSNCCRQHLVIDMEQEKIIRVQDTLIREEDLKEIQTGFLRIYNECTSDVCRLSDFISFAAHHYKISPGERERYQQGFENAGNSGARIWEEIKAW